MMKRYYFLLTMLILLLTVTFVGAQTYVGSSTCQVCHTADLTGVGYSIWNEFMKTGHPYKLNPVNGAPPQYPANTTPGVPNAPPANPDWNAYSYVIGGYGWKARFVQKDGYIFTSDLSAQYNLATQEWVPYHFGETKAYDYNCFKCHTTGPDPNGSWNSTTPDLGTFSEPGIRCEGCHGPGGDHVANPSNVTPPIVGDSLRYNRCGDCHSRGSKTNVIPAKGGFIRHHEQFNEMQASRHNEVGLKCGTCHDTHIPLLYPEAASNGLSAIKKDCQTCHTDKQILLNGQPKNVECQTCHMPKASKSAVGKQVGNGWKGDVATHIWKIDTRPVTRDSMFTSDGGQVRLDGSGKAAVTLDFVCLQCHQDKTVKWAATYADSIHEKGIVTGIDDDITELPQQFQLLQNYPNPFNPSTTIEYHVPKVSRVRIAVYNLLGQEIKVLVDGMQSPGIHRVTFDASNLPSGVYIYRMQSKGKVFSRKMLLMK